MKLPWWKWLGLAGLAGVAATGAAVARHERQRRSYTPDQVRERLHQRLAEAHERGGRFTGQGGSGTVAP